MKKREVRIGNVTIGGKKPLVIIAGPCVIESEKSTLKAASKLKKISERVRIPLIFKSSYDKANRTSVNSPRGPGLEKGLRVLEKIRRETGLPLLSDIHSVEEVSYAADVLDAFQIPAFLCRQTDLLTAASKTGKAVNIKKGQFLAPWDVKHIIEKCTSTGNHNVFITERGTSFGYNNLVVDMRALVIMQGFGYPVIFDATHSVQLPGGHGASSGGQREFVAPLARAAVAVGCDGLFLEVHPDPDRALCDGPNMLRMDDLAEILVTLKSIDELLK